MMSRVRVRLEPDGERSGVMPVGAGGSFRSDRLTRRFDAQEIFPNASTVHGAAAIARCEESLADAVEEFFRRPSLARFSATAVCRTTVTSAWSLLMLPQVALGRLGRFQFCCDQYHRSGCDRCFWLWPVRRAA